MKNRLHGSGEKEKPRRFRRVAGLLRETKNLWRGLQLVWRSRRLEFCPLIRILRAYTREDLSADLRAGFNVAVVGFPQGIAFALIAGLPPLQGLISVGIGASVGAAFSGSRLVVVGPGNSTAILLFSGLMAAGLDESQRVLVLPLFIFMVGCFQVLGALANVSLILNYVSRSVVTAYVTGAAALIIVNQTQNILGFRIDDASTFFSILGGTVSNLGQARLPEIVIGGASLLFLFGLRRFLPSVPDGALTLFVMTLVALYFDWLGWNLVYVAGFTPDAIRIFAFDFTFDMVATLAAPAFAVAFLGVVEGASVGRSLASRSGERINVNQIMFGMGLANLSNSVFGGMDASGSITRSAINFRSGARTAVSVIVSGGLSLVLLFTVGFFIGRIPMAALAAVVLIAAFTLFNGHQIKVALRATPADAVVFVTTLASALLFTLDTAIYIGVFTSVILFLRRAGVPELVEYGFTPEGQLAETGGKAEDRASGISILHAEGDLFFGSTELFVEQTRQAILDPNLKIVILRLKNARHIDGTCALAIEELLQILRASDRHLIISGANKEIFRVFRNSGLLEKIGRENFFMLVPSNPTLSTRNALKRAQQILGHGESDIRIFVDKRRQEEDPTTGV